MRKGSGVIVVEMSAHISLFVNMFPDKGLSHRNKLGKQDVAVTKCV